MIHIYCGDGKGKTTAACGLALRAAGSDRKVYLFFLFKPRTKSGEIKLFAKLENIEVFCFDKKHPFFVKKKKSAYRKKLKLQLKSFLKKACNCLKKNGSNVVILDEMLTALGERLISQKELLVLLKNRNYNTEVVLTGRLSRLPWKIFAIGDYVSEIKSLKHPYQKGISAREGIDY